MLSANFQTKLLGPTREKNLISEHIILITLMQVLTSDEALAVTSAIHTIRLRRVTASAHTFVEWVTDFSSDASTSVVEDRCPHLSQNHQ